MKKNIGLSYLIATKNREKYISELIESLMAQTVSNWEAVIVNDHGSEASKDIIERYSDPRLRYYDLRDDHGMGASCARNFAVQLANFKIVAIMDDDDIIYPERTELTLKAFRDDFEAEVFYGDIDIWEESTGVIRDRKTPIEPYSEERMKTQHFIPHVTVALKRQVLLDNPYNQFFRYAEDYELLTRLMVQGKKFVHTDKKLVKYRIAGQNISIGKDKQDIVAAYGELVKIIRGWAAADEHIINQIINDKTREA